MGVWNSMKNAFWSVRYRLRTWRGFLKLQWILFNRNWGIIAFSIAFGAIGLFQSVSSLSPYRDIGITAVVFLLAAMFFLWKDFRELFSALSNIRSLDFELQQALKNVVLPEDYGSDANRYSVELHPRGAAAYSPEINKTLRERSGHILLKMKPGTFDVFDHGSGIVPDVVKEVSPFLLRAAFRGKSILFNSPKVRLCSDLLLPRLKESGAALFVQKTDYFASVCTNEAALRRVYLREVMKLKELQLLSPDAEPPKDTVVLAPLRQSPCANHVGVSTIGITEDGHVIWTVQSGRSAQSANWIAPTGSGSADFSDLRNARCLEDFLTEAMERELRQECGIEGIRVDTKIIGYARLLHRGGKPEFFGFSRIHCGKERLKISAEESRFQSVIRRTPSAGDGESISPGNLAQELDRLQCEYGSAFSYLMHLNLVFLKRFLEDPGSGTGPFRS